MSLAEKINNNETQEIMETTEDAVHTEGMTDTDKARVGGGPLSDQFECLFILGSPFWTQPLRLPGNKHKKTLEALDPTKSAGEGKKSLGTYKASVPFAALFVAHVDLVVPRLPVERTAKTGYMPNEVKHITVKKGEEVVMTYLEIALLGMGPDFQNKFKFRGVSNGITIVPKEESFKKKAAVGPNGIRIPTPSLVATDGSNISAKKTMEMICSKDPYAPNRPVWGNTPRDLLYKERYEHMWGGRPMNSRRKTSTMRVTDSAPRTNPSTQTATNCRNILAKAYESHGYKLVFNTKPEDNTTQTESDTQNDT